MSGVDVAVVGAGPAGVQAAVAAAEAGASVALIDEGQRPGGQFFRQPARAPDGATAAHLREHYARGRTVLAGLEHPRITLYTGTSVWNLTPRRQIYLATPGGPLVLEANRVVLATGATERSAAFPGWTLPGVMTPGAVQSLLKGFGLIPSGRVVLGGSGPLLLAVARQLVDAGAQVAAVIEATSFMRWLRYAARFRRHRDRLWEGLGHWQRLVEARVKFQFGHVIVRAEGNDQGQCVQRVHTAHVDDEWRPTPGSTHSVTADLVAVSYGFVPATELARLAGCAHRFDPAIAAWVTTTDENLETSASGIYAAGEVRGIGGAEAALAEGRLAGLAAAGSLGYRPAGGRAAVEAARAEQTDHRTFAKTLFELFAPRPGLAALAADDTVICRCEGVTAGEVRAAARAGVHTINALKPWNRCGMGPCQGRTCGPIAAQLIAAEAGVSVEAAGVFTPRPPIKPVPLGVVGVVTGPRPTGPAMEDHVGYGRAIVK